MRRGFGVGARLRLGAALLLLLCVPGCGGQAQQTSEAEPTSPTAPTGPQHAKAEPIRVPQDLVFLQRNHIKVLDITGWERAVVSSREALGAPAWSNDGASLVYDTGERLWVKGVYDKWKPMPIHRCQPPCSSVRDAAWSPDGKMIAFAVSESEDNVHTSETSLKVFDMKKAIVKKIHVDSSPKHRTLRPRWSPDGSELVFEQDTVDSSRLDARNVISSRLVVAPVKRKGKPQVVVAAGQTGGPRAPDWGERGIVFTRAGNLYSVVPNAVPAHQLTQFDGTTEQAVEPTWSPAGGRIVFTYVAKEPGGVVHRMAGLVTAKGRGFHPLLRTEGASRPSLGP